MGADSEINISDLRHFSMLRVPKPVMVSQGPQFGYLNSTLMLSWDGHLKRLNVCCAVRPPFIAKACSANIRVGSEWIIFEDDAVDHNGVSSFFLSCFTVTGAALGLCRGLCMSQVPTGQPNYRKGQLC